MERELNNSIILNGYKYTFQNTNKSNNIRYYRCQQYRTLDCKVRAKLPVGAGKDDLIVTSKCAHTHPADDLLELEEQFRVQLKRMSLTSSDTPKRIFDTASLLYPDVAVRFSYPTMESSIRNWRAASIPRIPSDLKQYANILRDPDWNRYATTTDGIFFLGLVTASDGSNAVVLGNTNFTNKVMECCKDIHIDGTFKTTPNTPKCRQLLILLGVAYGQGLPLMYILMENKTVNLYTAVFNHIKEIFATNPTAIMLDFEVALYTSAQKIFANAEVKGCHFHYCQALYRKAIKMGLLKDGPNQELIKRTLKFYYALALLPAELSQEGFQYIKDQTPLAIRSDFLAFETYFERQWMQRVTPNMFSIFKCSRRTNNVLEAFNRRLGAEVGVIGPCIWKLHSTLQNLTLISNQNLSRLEKNLKITRDQRPSQIRFEKRLRELWNKLSSAVYSVSEFMQQALHLVIDIPNTNARGEDEEILLINGQEIFNIDNNNIEFNNDEVLPPDDDPIWHLPEDEFEPLPDDLFFPNENASNEMFPENIWWHPLEEDDDSPLPGLECSACLINKKTYVISCGHIFCGHCTAQIINSHNAKCPQCRALLLRSNLPIRVYV